MAKTELERFWEKVDTTEGCWNWTAYRNANGYGVMGIGGRRENGGRHVLAHRYSYELACGPIPEGLAIDHMCHNRACVNPQHLRTATQKQNVENQLGAHRDSRSGIRGVSWRPEKNKWRGRVRHFGVEYSAGSYATREEAEAAVVALRNTLYTHNDADRRAA